jgi:hypothetical protein
MLAGCVFAGLGLGLLLRALAARLRRDGKRSAARSSLGLTSLALAVLAGTGLLIFPDKTQLGDDLFRICAFATLGLGFLSGLLPRAFGIPLLVIVLAAAILETSALGGWLRIAEPRRIATLTPFVVDAAGFRGELAVEEKDTIAIIQKVELPTRAAGLVVERLELEGPLALLSGPSFYRVAGLRGGSGEKEPALAFPLEAGLVDRALPLDPGLDAARSLPFARRWREATTALPLVALEPQRYRLDPRVKKGPDLTVESGSPGKFCATRRGRR